MRGQVAVDGRQIVHCHVGAESFAVDLQQVQGFHRAERLQRSAGAPARLATGAGDVPVFPLADLLGRRQAAPSAASHVVVMKAEQGSWGFLADGVSGVMQLERSALRPLPPLLRRWPEIPGGSLVMAEQGPSLVLDAAKLRPEVPAEQLPPAPAEDALDEQQTASAAASNRILLFPLTQPGEGARPLSCGLGLSFVLEILDMPTLAPVPRAPSFLLGLAAWRSRAVPVIDLADRLGLPPTSHDHRGRLLILRAGNAGPLGLLISQAARVVSLPLEHAPCRRPLPIDVRAIHGAVETTRETILIPNLSWMCQEEARVP